MDILRNWEEANSKKGVGTVTSVFIKNSVYLAITKKEI